MTFKKVDHIAIAVPDLDEAVSLYKSLLGKSPEQIEELKGHKVRIALFSIGDTNLELLSPLSNDSPISDFLEKKKQGGIHHICLEVANIEEHLEKLKKDGFKLIDEKSRSGAQGKKIAFVNPKSTNGVLIELSEKK